jgi:hypothetical protein
MLDPFKLEERFAVPRVSALSTIDMAEGSSPHGKHHRGGLEWSKINFA